jgi:hypothetical protein
MKLFDFFKLNSQQQLWIGKISKQDILQKKTKKMPFYLKKILF